MKTPLTKENLHVHIVNDYGDTWFSNFAIEYLRENVRENENVNETVFACWGPDRLF